MSQTDLMVINIHLEVALMSVSHKCRNAVLLYPVTLMKNDDDHAADDRHQEDVSYKCFMLQKNLHSSLSFLQSIYSLHRVPTLEMPPTKV